MRVAASSSVLGPTHWTVKDNFAAHSCICSKAWFSLHRGLALRQRVSAFCSLPQEQPTEDSFRSFLSVWSCTLPGVSCAASRVTFQSLQSALCKVDERNERCQFMSRQRTAQPHVSQKKELSSRLGSVQTSMTRVSSRKNHTFKQDQATLFASHVIPTWERRLYLPCEKVKRRAVPRICLWCSASTISAQDDMA